MGKQLKRKTLFQKFKDWLLMSYADVLLPSQRSTVVGEPWNEDALPPGVVERVKRVLREAHEILDRAWQTRPTHELVERCGVKDLDLPGDSGKLRKLLCVLALEIERLDARYARKKNAPALVAANKLYDFVERWLQEEQPHNDTPAVKYGEAVPTKETPLERAVSEEVPTKEGGFTLEPEVASIGRIAPTSRHPAGVGRFPFWAETTADLSLGELVVAEGKGPDGQPTKVFAAVEDLWRESSFESPMQHFAAHDLGTASAELATEPLYPLVGEAAVIHRSDGRSTPPGGAWPIRPATAREAEEAINKDVDERWAIPAGVVSLRKDYAVAHYDLRFIAGPEGGHVNISGISGVAAKTSYAVFLLTGLLAQSARSAGRGGGGLAAVLFNVKEEDLMSIHLESAKWERALLQASGRVHASTARIYKKIRERMPEFNPGRLFRRIDNPEEEEGPGVVYLAPQHPNVTDKPVPFTAVEQSRYDEVIPFQFDLLELGPRLLSAFDPDDLDEKLETTLRYLIDRARDKKTTTLEGFRGLIVNALEKAGAKSRGSEVGHPLTLQKLRHRFRGVVQDLKGLVAENRKVADPPDLERLLRPGRVLVFDVTQISERARRVLIGWLIDELERLLMERKALTGGLDTWPPKDLPIPSRIAVFADELNRFAPKVGWSEVGRILGRVAAQGRSYGLAIIGMQQQASRVGEQILTNSSTLVVGRSHAAELGRGDAYGWMSRGLKSQAADLDKGQVIASHPAWRQPLILRFPLPHHHFVEQVLEEE